MQSQPHKQPDCLPPSSPKSRRWVGETAASAILWQALDAPPRQQWRPLPLAGDLFAWGWAEKTEEPDFNFP